MPRLVVRQTARKTNRRNEKPKKAAHRVRRVHQREIQKYQDFMFRYKIGNGRRKVTIQHNGKYNYGVTKCPDSFGNRGKGCPRGQKCKFAHSTLEVLFHPLVYKTRECSKVDAGCEQGSQCAWAHSASELRIRRFILGANWRLSDPTHAEGERMRRAKMGRRNGQTRRVKIESHHVHADDDSSVWGSESVVSATPSRTPMRTATPSNESERMSVSASPAVDERVGRAVSVETEIVREDEDEKRNEPKVEQLIRTAAASSEFSCWFRSMYNCEDIRLPFVTYLSRFESKNLDDISFLFELLCDSHNHRKLAELLVNEIGWLDDTSRDCFEGKLWQYMRPVDPRAWMARRVKLPQYCELFSGHSNVYIVAQTGIDNGDLVEMGVSSPGHRAKILYYLEKLELELSNERDENEARMME